MTKQEFINELRLSLTGRMDTPAINENIRYYEDYITAEVRKGASEEQVLSDIGDPNAIAISLIDAAERAANKSSENYTNQAEANSEKSTQKTSLWLRLISFFLSHPIISIIIIFAIILVIIVLAVWLAISILTQIWPLILILALAAAVGFLVYSLIKIINHSGK